MEWELCSTYAIILNNLIRNVCVCALGTLTPEGYKLKFKNNAGMVACPDNRCNEKLVD